MEQGKARIAGTMKIAQQDTINTPIGIRINAYLRQENENDYLYIWSANRSFLDEVKIQGTSMGPKTSAQMPNESLVIDDHEIQDDMSELQNHAAVQLANDCGWKIPEGTRIVTSLTQSPHPWSPDLKNIEPLAIAIWTRDTGN
eukprot:5698680-Heterocapsa_arctica.AAC.1